MDFDSKRMMPLASVLRVFFGMGAAIVRCSIGFPDNNV